MADTNIWTNTATLGTYTTGGFNVTTGLSSVANFNIKVNTRGSLPVGHFEWSSSGGIVTVKYIQHSHDKLTSIDGLTGLPSGVTSAATNGQTYDSDTTHVHAIDHDHAAATSTALNAGASGTATAVTGNWSAHTHSFDPPNFTGNSGAGSSHNHTWNNLYQHSHNITNTSTNATQAELANSTDLSSVTVIYHAVDQ